MKNAVFHHMTPVILITASLPLQDNDLLSPGIIINSSHCSGSGSGSGLTLEGSRHLSRSNIDIPRSSGPDDPKKQLPRKRSDSSTYELDTIKQHQAFLTRWATDSITLLWMSFFFVMTVLELANVSLLVKQIISGIMFLFQAISDSFQKYKIL